MEARPDRLHAGIVANRWKAVLPGFHPAAAARATRPVDRATLAFMLAAGVGMVGVFGLHQAWQSNSGMLRWVLIVAAGAVIGLMTLAVYIRSSAGGSRSHAHAGRHA